MGAVKDGYDIIFDLWDRITGQKKKKKRHLSDDLSAIASLLDDVKIKLKQREIPRREAKELGGLIYNAYKLATPFKKEYPELADVFDIQLKKIGVEMQIADYFIEEELRDDRLSDDKRNLLLSFGAQNQIDEACKELERAAGVISSYSRLFKQKGE
jgi:hypothetical protein